MSVAPEYGLKVPEGHSLHVTLSARALYVPGWQILGSYVPYPWQVYPAGQVRHSTLDFSGANVPGKHSVDATDPAREAKVPMGTTTG